MRRILAVVPLALWAVLASSSAPAEEKLVVLDDLPRDLSRFTVSPDGRRLYFAGPKYLVLDPRGRLLDQIGVPQGAPRDLNPLPDGWFISGVAHANGHIALCRPDGTEAKVLVARGDNEQTLRADMTGWSSPTGIAVDPRRKLIFALDTTQAPRDVPDPNWSRIAVFDFEGKFIRDMNRYDATAKAPDDSRRTWYDDIGIDPRRQRVYVLARRTAELLAFTYEGAPAGRTKAPAGGGLAVFPDGRVAVGAGSEVQLFDPTLRPASKLDASKLCRHGGITDLETDDGGRLYAATSDPSTTFIRWSPDLKGAEAVGPRYRRLNVEFPDRPARAGEPFRLAARVEGRPEPEAADRWQVMLRPSDGSDLRWRALGVEASRGTLTATLPRELRGLYEIAVRFGSGPIDWANRPNDLFVQKTVAVVPEGARRSVAVVTATGRRAFGAGEPIALHVVRRPESREPAEVTLEIRDRSRVLTAARLSVAHNLACVIPESVTRLLPAGPYRLVPSCAGHDGEALAIDIAPAGPDSPLERIAYQEFGQGATSRNDRLADTPERMAYVRDYVRQLTDLGFTRETDRRANSIDRKNGPRSWRRDQPPAAVDDPGLAPADAYAIPSPAFEWEAEYYLDRGLTRGLRYDTQLLGHCSGVRFREPWLSELSPVVQRAGQWLGRYPAFRGFNYNDEMFFGGFASEWTKDDDEWLKKVGEEQFRGRPRADVLEYALRLMYDRFNAAARQVDPSLKLTTTPMWQFPAVEGSYAPVIYAGMDETYSHYLSEGYLLPWYPAHSVEMLRRPGLPMMGVFDNTYRGSGGDVYLKNLAQVVARGVQGVGVEHTLAFDDPKGADAYRVANHFARLFGPIFAEAPPANEAAVLYSRTQDVTEARNMMGTPHWERVYAAFGAGLMAGIPMSIAYEEDVADGWLLDGGRPRVPMLLLVGQTRPLPEKVRGAVAAFAKAGGRVFSDADGSAQPGAKTLSFGTHVLRTAMHEGYAADSAFPLMQPLFERLAREMHTALAAHRRFPIDTDDPWVSANQFDGGAIRYLMVASETSPYPWEPGAVWALGAQYNRSYLPKTVTVTFPARSGVVYDLFEHELVRPEARGEKSAIAADLRTFPGRLYALAPAPLGSPRVVLREEGASAPRASLAVQVVTEAGEPLRARVPIRIRVGDAERTASVVVRGTGLDGVYEGPVPIPATPGDWSIEVTEVLGGRTSRVACTPRTFPAAPVRKRPGVEAHREAQIRELLGSSKGRITLVAEPSGALSGAGRAALAAALKAQGITVETIPAMPDAVRPGVYVVAGSIKNTYAKGGNFSADPLWLAWQRGLLDEAVSEIVPGAGRGFFTAVFAPRGDQEHAIALLGGDAEGLARTVDAFVAWLKSPEPSPEPASTAAPTKRTGSPADPASLSRLRDLVGAKLSEVVVAEDGRHLLVSSEGMFRNLALVEDQGTTARVVRATRVGQSPTIGSLHVSPDGTRFGGSAREVARLGQGFHLVDAASGAQEVFAGFGDLGRQRNRFAVNDRGDLALVPGTHGVACWKRETKGWREAWAIDAWKDFAKLDWPVSEVDERIPHFDAFLPRKSEVGLVLFSETANNGWITPDHPNAAWLAAVDLRDGKTRWRFDVPIPKTQLFPTLHTSPDGSRLLLQVQMGSWNKETFRFFSIERGQAVGSWDTKTEPLAVAIAGADGSIGAAFKERLIERRRPDGSLVVSRLWPCQPISLAFAEDGGCLYVSDDAGRLTCLDAKGYERWRTDAGGVAALAAKGRRIYAACWDGRLRSFDAEGRPRWSVDLTPELRGNDPMAEVVAAQKIAPGRLHEVHRSPTASAKIPEGENLLRNGRATLTLGGTKGWMSEGTVEVKPEQLTNGRRDDVRSPWLNVDELFWDASGGRQVWAEVAFKEPTDVRSLTVYENPDRPDSWPGAGVVQVWNESLKRWETAARGDFLEGPVTTYSLDLRRVAKLRYVPWTSYDRNFYTSEIEVR